MPLVTRSQLCTASYADTDAANDAATDVVTEAANDAATDEASYAANQDSHIACLPHVDVPA